MSASQWRSLRRICQPLIKFTPQLGAEGRRLSRPLPPPRQPAPPQAPVDVEEDDPYGVAPMSQGRSPNAVARAPSHHPAPAAYTSAPPPIRASPSSPTAPSCLFERGEKHPYETITLARCSLDWLKGK